MVSSSIALYLGLLSLSLTNPGAHLFLLDKMAHEPIECLFLCFLALGFRLAPPPCLVFMWVLEIGTQVLILASKGFTC